MMQLMKKYKSMGLVLILCFAFLLACTKEVNSRPNFVFKSAPDQNAAAKVDNEVITKSQLFSGIEGEIFELQQKIYELKLNKLRAYLLEKFMNEDPKKKGLSNDEYLERHIVSKVKISDQEIDDFLKERGIPKEQHTEEIKAKVKNFLGMGKKKEAVEQWVNDKTAKNPVEVYLERPERPFFEVEPGDAPFTGGADAKVTIVEFSDFQCPYCAKGVDLIKKIKEKYGKKIKVAFKNFPLPFHSHAKIAAVAGLCAHEQGKFWEMHDLMFAHQQEKLDPENLKKLAGQAGVKSESFNKCLDEQKYASKVDADIQYGQKFGVKSTPTFYVNGRLINGVQDEDVFYDVIDQELSR